MRHFVIVKFEPGYFDTGVYEYIRLTFARLQVMLPEDILFCRVSRSCAEREGNADIMIEMELKEPRSVEAYRQHPLYGAVWERLEEYVVRKICFDCQ